MNRWRSWGLVALLGATWIGNVLGQPAGSPFMLHYKRWQIGTPVAIYRDIKGDAFRKLLIGAFEASGFSFVAIARSKDDALEYRFSYPVPGKAQSVVVMLRVDENLDKNKKCVSCFLRFPQLPDIAPVTSLPWMVQYELSSQVFPGIDGAFERIRVDGQKYMDASFGFNYSNLWLGERNLRSNSFSSIALPELKATTVDAFRAAGFVFTGEDVQDQGTGMSTLSFVFPLEPGQTAGAVYKILLLSQLDASGRCATCEMSESFDPHQTLPAAGLSGVTSRLTLESRFAAARTLAYEKLRGATERYLRPRSVFTVPPKPAPLGSPRPQYVPPVVT